MSAFRIVPRTARSVCESSKAQKTWSRTLSTNVAGKTHLRQAAAKGTLLTSSTWHNSRSRQWPAPISTNLTTRRSQSSTAVPAPTFYTDAEPGRTALYDLHLEHGGKMVPFGGYSMPVQYSDLSITESHLWTREKCSMFDVGHMVQYHIEGPGAEAFLETLTPSGLKDLQPGYSTLSALLHPTTGGICDDCVITRLDKGPEHLFYFVANAGNRQKDYTFLSNALETWSSANKPPVHLRHLEAEGSQPFGLIALQGPMAAEILGEALHPACKVDLKKWYFGSTRHVTLALPDESLPIVASRAGYTGEDGFEISIHPSQTVAVARRLLEVGGKDRLRMAGLGARDSLRLEAGMCLYEHDINDETTPPEAGLGWVVARSRRDANKGGFNGAERIVPQLTPVSKGGAGMERRRVGLIVEGAPAREGAEIVDEGGVNVGHVTSGCPSPSLKKNIAMGYVRDGMHKSGTEVLVVVRGKKRKAVVTKMPFLPSQYFKEGIV